MVRVLEDKQQAIAQACRRFGVARMYVFGSALRDDFSPGTSDIDLLVELPHAVENPAWLSARISGRISHRLGGRKIDVLVCAPNLKQLPIHAAARRQGARL